MKICTVVSCDRIVYARSWCRMHYQRWSRHGDPLETGRSSLCLDVKDGEFARFVEESDSIAEVLRKIGVTSPTGATYKMFHRKAKALSVSYDHFLGQGHNSKKGLSAADVLKKNVDVSNSVVKRILFNELGWVQQCSICGNGDSWMGKPLTIQLDHVDGNNTNNQLSNLRLLCPNCHSQTETYCRRK